ncbi:MAG: RES domain-containing protein [Verrucomicrobiales bacterium]
MNDNNEYQIDVPMTGQLNEAVLNGYIRTIEINDDWVSYRHPDYPFDSASLQEGRFNLSGQTAFYAASGDYCGQFEVPNYYERVPCSVKKHTIYAFDLPAFAADYNHEEAFVQQHDDGGWDICQEVSNYLTTSHPVSGVLYQSAACHKEGQHGICLAVLPSQEQTLPNEFFVARTDKAEQGGSGQPATRPEFE